MELDPGNDPESHLTGLPEGFPSRGLDEVLTRWIGPGDALGRLAQVLANPSWTARDIRARAQHLLLARLADMAVGLPTRLRDWHEAVPASLSHLRITASAPARGVRWAETIVSS